jgi:hypothetical protein
MDQIVSFSVRLYPVVLVNGQYTKKIQQCLGKNADFVYVHFLKFLFTTR